MDLSPEEQRVLGALIEKHMTTPDHYPLTTNALVAACNQSSNRSPVVAYEEGTVIDAMNALRERGLARTVRRHGERAMKHQETVDEPLEVDRHQKALLAVLLLRGPQTPGELRSRTERYVDFPDLADVERNLTALSDRDEPLVVRLEREPGQKEARYAHLLGGSPPPAVSGSTVVSETSAVVTTGAPGSDGPQPAFDDELGRLRVEVARLREEVAELRRAVERGAAPTSGPFRGSDTPG